MPTDGTLTGGVTDTGRPSSRDALICAALFAASVATRLPFRTTILYAWDSVNYAFGMRQFDVAHDQPQAPGYIVYVWLCRLVDTIFHNANDAMVWVSIVAGGLAVVAVFLVGRTLRHRTVGVLAALLLLSSPLFWFYGDIALPHTLDAALVATAAWLLYRIWQGEQQLVWPAAVVLAVAGGVREQTLVFLLPLTVVAVWRVDRRRLLAATLLAALVCLVWFVPLIRSTGGLRAYLHVTSAYSARFDKTTSIFAGAGLPAVASNVKKLVVDTLYASAAALVPLVLAGAIWLARCARRRRRASPSSTASVAVSDPVGMTDRRTALFLALWVTPALVFYVFVHMGQQGMIFIFFPVVVLLAALALYWVAHGRSLVLAATLLVAANALAFTFLPQHLPGFAGELIPDRQTLAANDRYYSERFSLIRHEYPAQSTAIVASNWRHVEYYLPQYVLLRLGAAATSSGADRPNGWPGADGSLAATDLIPLAAPPATVDLLLFDDYESRLFSQLAPVQTVPVPGAGTMTVYRLTGERRLRYDAVPLTVESAQP